MKHNQDSRVSQAQTPDNRKQAGHTGERERKTSKHGDFLLCAHSYHATEEATGIRNLLSGVHVKRKEGRCTVYLQLDISSMQQAEKKTLRRKQETRAYDRGDS